jgi:hypothetical protein
MSLHGAASVTQEVDVVDVGRRRYSVHVSGKIQMVDLVASFAAPSLTPPIARS